MTNEIWNDAQSSHWYFREREIKTNEMFYNYIIFFFFLKKKKNTRSWLGWGHTVTAAVGSVKWYKHFGEKFG